MPLFFGIVVLALVLWGLNAYSKADPKYLAKVLRPAGGILAVAAAAFLFFRGHLEVAIPLGLTGLGLLGWGPFASTGWFQRTQKTPGQVSRVRAPRVEMELDHDSGTMRGTRPRRPSARRIARRSGCDDAARPARRVRCRQPRAIGCLS